MNLSYTAEEERFRAELRAWLEANPAIAEPERLDDLAGLTMGGPVLIAHGTEQKRRHLQRILAADEI